MHVSDFRMQGASGALTGSLDPFGFAKKALAHNRVNQRRRQVVLGGCAYASLCGQFSQECDEPAEVLESVDALLSLDPEVASVEELPPRWSVL